MSNRKTRFALLALVSPLAGACDSVLSIRTLDATGAADGGGTCATCANQNCADEADACAADPVFCAPYQSCLGSCDGGAACRSQCTINYPPPLTGSAAISALSACLAGKCATQCNLTCGGFAGYLSEPDMADKCESCLEQYASTDSVACGSSVDCDAYWRCFTACPTPDCKLNCALEHEAGVAQFRPLQQDFAGDCSGPCGFGNYWACVGHISWPAAMSAQVELTAPVIDFVTDKPVPGETVSVCAFCPCGTAVDPVLGSETSDDSGTVTLPLTQTSTGLDGCVQVTSPTGATVPYYGFWGYPLSEPVVNPALGPGTPLANLVAQSAQVFTPLELGAATGYLDETLLPGRGMLGASVFDCFDNPAGAARVSLNTSDYYGPGDTGVMSGGEVTTSTTSTGWAFFFNVLPGIYQVTAMPASLDGGVSSIVNVGVIDGGTTAAGMFPTPLAAMFLNP